MLVDTLHGLLTVFGEHHLGAFVTQQLFQEDAIDLVVLGREQANARQPAALGRPPCRRLRRGGTAAAAGAA